MAITLTSKKGYRPGLNHMARHAASNGMKVLIIDGDPGARSDLKNSLQSKGHRVYTAFDGEHGATLADRVRPDLIILAPELPKMSGYDVSAVLTEQQSMSSIPRIILSGKQDPEDIARALKGFADAIIIKPVENSQNQENSELQNHRRQHRRPYRRSSRRKRRARKLFLDGMVKYFIAAFVVFIVSLFVSGIIPNVFVSYTNTDDSLRSQMKIYQPRDVERHLYALSNVIRSMME